MLHNRWNVINARKVNQKWYFSIKSNCLDIFTQCHIVIFRIVSYFEHHFQIEQFHS